MFRMPNLLNRMTVFSIVLIALFCVSGCALLTLGQNQEKVYVHKTQKDANNQPIYIYEDYYNNLTKEDKRNFEFYGRRSRSEEQPSVP